MAPPKKVTGWQLLGEAKLTNIRFPPPSWRHEWRLTGTSHGSGRWVCLLCKKIRYVAQGQAHDNLPVDGCTAGRSEPPSQGFGLLPGPLLEPILLDDPDLPRIEIREVPEEPQVEAEWE